MSTNEINFKESDFKKFRNMSNPKDYYYFAEKELKNHTIDVNAGRFMINFEIEIKEKKSQKTIADGVQKSLVDLNKDINRFISLNPQL